MQDPLNDDPVTHIEVAVNTPEGAWPTEGFFLAPAGELIREQLEHAARELKLGDTAGWVARAGGRDLNPAASFSESGLCGRVVIRFGPRG